MVFKNSSISSDREQEFECNNIVGFQFSRMHYLVLNGNLLCSFKSIHNSNIQIQSALSRAELLYKDFKVMKEKLKSPMKETILERHQGLL